MPDRTSQPAPFQGRKPTRAERKRSQRRSREIQSAFAAAMPPPDPSSRRDPLTGEPTTAVSPGDAQQARAAGPVTGSARPGQQWPSSAVPLPSRGPERGVATQPAAAVGPRAPKTKKHRPSRRAASPVVAATSGLPSLAAVARKAERPSMARRVAGQWTGRTGALTLLAGAPLAALAAMAGAGAGLPVLGHGTDWHWLAGGGTAALILGAAATRGWQATGARARVAVPAVSLLLVTAFGVGLASDPVVVDGRAQLATSKTARSAHMAQQMRTDLYDLVRYDDLLAASQEDARANVAQYEPAAKQLNALMVRYSSVAADVPDPAFAAPAAKIKSAAYWGLRAMQVKAELIDQDDAKKSADLESYRATYATEVLAAGEQLNQAAASLDIPFTLREEGPHE